MSLKGEGTYYADHSKGLIRVPAPVRHDDGWPFVEGEKVEVEIIKVNGGDNYVIVRKKEEE